MSHTPPTIIHPQPPSQADFDTLTPTIASWTGDLYRSLSLQHRSSPLYFNPHRSSSRWASPHGSFSVSYTSTSIEGAYIETAQLDQFISLSWIKDRGVRALSILTPLRLWDLTGPGLSRMGATAQLCTSHHATSQNWSECIYHHPSCVDGIMYNARHDPSCISVALYDRAQAHVTTCSVDGWLEMPMLRNTLRVLEHYGHNIDITR